MPKVVLNTHAAPAAIGPYSQGFIVNDHTAYVSGQIPVNPETGAIPADIKSQTAQSLENVKAILAKASMAMSDVVKTTVFITDMGDFDAVNEVYATYFAEPAPARSCVQVAALPKGVKIEIEAIAAK